jgi:ankyrin repeat protein
MRALVILLLWIAISITDTSAQALESIPHDDILEASKRGDTSSVYSILTRGSEIVNYLNIRDSNGNTALHYASGLSRTFELAEILIQKGANVNAINNVGHTPLHSACSNGLIETAKILHSNGAEIDTIDKAGRSVLRQTIENGETAVAEFLIVNGANIHVKDYEGNTAMHLASSKEMINLMRLLVEYGADVNEPNLAGQSSLHFACVNSDRRRKAADELLYLGADLTMIDIHGYTPLDMPACKSHAEDLTSRAAYFRQLRKKV